MKEKTFSNYIKLTNRVFPIGVILFVIVLFGMFLHDIFICEPNFKEIQDNLDYISKYENSFDKIRLIKSTPGYEVNLIMRDSIISNEQDISQIRAMIIHRSAGRVSNIRNDWEVLIILYLSNDKKLEIEINQQNVDSKNKKTALFFASGNCDDDNPDYSIGLGEYLEKLVNYNGERYKKTTTNSRYCA